MALKVRVALEASAAGIPEVVIAGKARLLGGFPGTRIMAGEGSGTGRVSDGPETEALGIRSTGIPRGHEVKR
jgi:hypothetical protein